MKREQLKLLNELAQFGEVKYILKSKRGLIKAISDLDITSIGDILEDELTYQDVSKELFLEKLNEAFDKFKTEDDFLIPYEGKCNSEGCSNKSKNGVAFVGNISGRYLNLIIELFDDCKIKDVYHCSDFCPTAFELDENKRSISINVYLDEKVKFHKTKVFKSIDEEAVNAIKELSQFENKIISSEDLKRWKEKYESLYNQLELSILYKNLNKFSSYFYHVKDLCSYLECENEAQTALKEYSNSDINNEMELLVWLVKYESLFKKLILLPGNTIAEEGIEKGKQKLFRDSNIFFSIDIFSNNLSFYEIFDKYYYTKLKEYSTLTVDEQEAMMPFDDNFEELNSLKFHLQKRGII